MELYDLNGDPGETRDVASTHPETVKRFEEFLKTARTDSELWPIRENLPPQGQKKKSAAAEKAAKAR